MKAQSARKVTNDEKFKTVLDFIHIASLGAESQVLLAPHWIKGIKGRLRDAGYQLGRYTGTAGDSYGTWAVVYW